MDIYRTEEEQIEAIKRFFNQYGTHLLIVTAVLISLFFGYQWWNKSQESDYQQASTYFNTLNQLAGAGKMSDQESLAKFEATFSQLLKEYPDSIYSSYATLMKAKVDVDAGELEKAVKSLQWVIDAKVSTEIVDLASLRMARIEFARGELDKALRLLESPTTTFSAEYEELKGDIYAEKKDNENALLAYKKAKELRSEDNTYNDNLLQLKMAGVSGFAAPANNENSASADAATK